MSTRHGFFLALLSLTWVNYAAIFLLSTITTIHDYFHDGHSEFLTRRQNVLFEIRTLLGNRQPEDVIAKSLLCLVMGPF